MSGSLGIQQQSRKRPKISFERNFEVVVKMLWKRWFKVSCTMSGCIQCSSVVHVRTWYFYVCIIVVKPFFFLLWKLNIPPGFAGCLNQQFFGLGFEHFQALRIGQKKYILKFLWFQHIFYWGKNLKSYFCDYTPKLIFYTPKIAIIPHFLSLFLG